MSAPQFEHFLNRLKAVYGDPKSDDVNAFMFEYARKLSGYSDAELREGCDLILDKHKFSMWPTISECERACADVRRKREASSGIPLAGEPGEGWRKDSKGRRWWQIQRGSDDWNAWMRFFHGQGRPRLVKVMNLHCRTWCVPGRDPEQFGAMMMAELAAHHPDGDEKKPSDRYKPQKGRD